MRITSSVRFSAALVGVLSIAFAGASYAHAAGTFASFSWSATSLVPGATSTYTFTYTTSTDVPGSTGSEDAPGTILEMAFPFNFTAGGVENLSATVDGVPQTVTGDTYYADRAVFLRIANAVPAGSHVVVTIQDVVNANSAGTYTFQLNPYTSTAQGNAIDEAASVDPIVLAAAPVSPFDGGTGTSGDPYQISTCEQLEDMADDLTADYQLAGDIDCSDTENWNEGSGFVPVGDSTAAFTGDFDGNGHVISGLFINDPEVAYIGLFGKIGVGGSVSNVGITGADITGKELVGTLAGVNWGSVSQSYAEDSTVTAAYASADGAGGLLGASPSTYTSGAPTSGVTVADSYTLHVNVSGAYAVGGLVGDSYNGTFTDTYAVGTVDATSEYWGPLVGNAGSVYASFFNADVQSGDGGDYGTYGADETTAQMTDGAIYTNASWDFDDTWVLRSGYHESYPYLAWQSVVADAPPADTSAPVTSDDDLVVSNLAPASLTLSWTKATDDTSTQSALQYRVYQSTSDDMNTISDAEDNGTALDDWTADIGTLDIASLSADTDYYFAILVKDEAGNIARYNVATVTTPAPEEEHGSSRHSGGGSVRTQVANLTANGNAAAADALKAQWPNLFGSAAAGTGGASSAPSVRDLELGMTGSDVLALQKLLNANGSALAAEGIGSAGSETTYFGTLTKTALAAYQAAHGIVPAAGYFGSITRAQMKGAGLAGMWW